MSDGCDIAPSAEFQNTQGVSEDVSDQSKTVENHKTLKQVLVPRSVSNTLTAALAATIVPTNLGESSQRKVLENQLDQFSEHKFNVENMTTTAISHSCLFTTRWGEIKCSMNLYTMGPFDIRMTDDIKVLFVAVSRSSSVKAAMTAKLTREEFEKADSYPHPKQLASATYLGKLQIVRKCNCTEEALYYFVIPFENFP